MDQPLRAGRRASHTSLVLGALVALLALPGPAGAATTVQKGDNGRTVARLQRALGLPADGIFGPGTARALKRFQRRHHIQADGIAGPATWSLLRSSTRSVSSRGGAKFVSRGPVIAALQRALGIGADGVFGSQTARAVKRFQRAHGLTADGVVGPATWSALGIQDARHVLRKLGSHRGSRPGLPDRLTLAIAAANRIAGKPYIWGGGHGSFSAAGYDCSGSVSYVLHAAGALARPMDSGELMSYGSPGPGRYITVYANAGHAFMTINGRRYDTTGRGTTGSRWQPEARSSAGYVIRHPPGL
jgi:hypothetical protein